MATEAQTSEQLSEQLNRMGRRPPTPRDLIADLIERDGLSQSECARRLGVSRRRVIALIKGRKFTAATAQRLGEVFGTGPEVWLRMQQQAEAWDALHGQG